MISKIFRYFFGSKKAASKIYFDNCAPETVDEYEEVLSKQCAPKLGDTEGEYTCVSRRTVVSAGQLMYRVTWRKHGLPGI